MAITQSSDPSEEFPGLHLAYERATVSYQEIAPRYDAVNHRIDQLLTLTTTVTLAAPLIVAATHSGIELVSPLFLTAAFLFVVSLCLGGVARGFGSLTLIAPAELHAHWLGLHEREFKLRGVYWAGQHFEASARAIWQKSWMAHGMTGLLLIETLLLISWIGTGI